MEEPNLPNTKDRARRIDPRYVRHPQPWRRTRRWLVLTFCAAVLIWLGLSSFERAPDGKFIFTAMAHNPGHVSAAHAMIEHDCLACHAGDGRGGFIKTVSDSACLKCHDAGIHSVNQTTLKAKVMPLVAASADSDSAPEVTAAPSSDAPAIPIDNHPSGLRSADCVHCHIEHQGEAALRATDNAYCIECHTNLKDHFQKLSPDDRDQSIANHVVAFDGEGNHPHFGLHPDPASDLVLINGKPGNRTRLRFNHALHNGQDSLKNNCVTCHTPMSPSPSATLAPVPGSPLSLAKDRPLSSAAQLAKLGDMQPISFERNCIQCHTLDLVNEKNGRVRLTVSHSELAIVRTELAALPTLALQQQHPGADESPSWDDRTSAVNDQISPLLDKVKSMTDAARASTQPSTGTPSNDADASRTAAVSRYVLWLMDGGAGVAETPTTQPRGSATISVPDPSATEVFVTTVGSSRLIGTSCAVCHDFTGGDAPAGFAYKAAHPPTGDAQPAAADFPASRGFPTSAPTTQPTFLATIPTGIPSTPRRWFVNSHFDHAAHRDLSCFNCHADAWTSTDTAELLIPDLDSSNVLQSAQERKSNGIKSCIDCHGPPASSGELSAPSNCITCHVYHDRTKEDSMDASIREKHHSSTMPSQAQPGS